MRWRFNRREEWLRARHQRTINWHRAFAFLPHPTPDGWVWLEWAERRGYYSNGYQAGVNTDAARRLRYEWRYR